LRIPEKSTDWPSFDERNRTLSEREVVAAILSAVLTAHKRTAADDVIEAVKTYHACLDALQRFGEVPAEARWSAASENRRLTEEAAARKP
jgi:molecular chaperone DnaK (HSP70)